MLEKLYDMGILSSVTKLSEVERKVGVSRMARRRVGVVMTRLGMADTVTAAVKFVEQGHVRVGVLWGCFPDIGCGPGRRMSQRSWVVLRPPARILEEQC